MSVRREWGDQPLPEDAEIAAAHPLKSGRHDLYGEAMRLVGARRSKAALVELVMWLLLRADAVKAEPPETSDPKAPRKWRHLKRGTLYTEVCRAELQATTYDPKEGEQIVVYRGEDGRTWARAAGEFNDGRFAEVAADGQ